MKHNIFNAKHTQVKSELYFIDSNVWIYALQNDDELDWWEKIYRDFFYDIIESTFIQKPKIILSSLLLSEIINTYLKKIAIVNYRKVNNIPNTKEINFKRDYRPTLHYKKSFEKIMNNISNLKSSILFVDDSKIANYTALINKNIGLFDYNDYLYYCLCKELNKTQKVIIVTNDSDFQVNDIEIVTMNKTLLTL